jgi:hypothetical protein
MRRGPEAGILRAMSALHIFQILNHYTSQELDPDFEVLDNSANQRLDWYEYWPIRKFLLNEPRSERAAREFIAGADSATEVVLSSPRARQGSIPVDSRLAKNPERADSTGRRTGMAARAADTARAQIVLAA